MFHPSTLSQRHDSTQESQLFSPGFNWRPAPRFNQTRQMAWKRSKGNHLCQIGKRFNEPGRWTEIESFINLQKSLSICFVPIIREKRHWNRFLQSQLSMLLFPLSFWCAATTETLLKSLSPSHVFKKLYKPSCLVLAFSLFWEFLMLLRHVGLNLNEVFLFVFL